MYSDPSKKFITVKNGNIIRMKIHPPDSVTKYHHVHIYNSRQQALDKYGKLVSPKSSTAHIPYIRW